MRDSMDAGQSPPRNQYEKNKRYMYHQSAARRPSDCARAPWRARSSTSLAVHRADMAMSGQPKINTQATVASDNRATRQTTGVTDVTGTTRHEPHLRSRTNTHNLLFNSVVTPNSNYWLSSPNSNYSFTHPACYMLGRIALKVIHRLRFKFNSSNSKPSSHIDSNQTIHIHNSHMQYITRYVQHTR